MFRGGGTAWGIFDGIAEQLSRYEVLRRLPPSAEDLIDIRVVQP